MSDGTVFHITDKSLLMSFNSIYIHDDYMYVYAYECMPTRWLLLVYIENNVQISVYNYLIMSVYGHWSLTMFM